jgi:predicted alpha/beta superfamily hydrolase
MNPAIVVVAAATVLLSSAGGAQDAVPVISPTVTGTLLRYADFPSAQVSPRNVDVWLPPGYAADRTRRYPVLYMHDGQNLFDSSTTSMGNPDWDIDGTLTRLIAVGAAEPAIVVGVWNRPGRRAEYAPQVLTPFLPDSVLRWIDTAQYGPPFSDRYLRFLVTELKPFVDRTYRTLRDPAHTSVMGSSMGGLVSVYALCEYPHVFGAAAGVSTHWPAGVSAMREYLERRLPRAGSHRIYYDYGTLGLDSAYEPYQVRIDSLMHAGGYREPKDWVTLKFPGADHNERAWRARVHYPLLFLLGRRP